ncbi:hypothetical protein K525DRAFT_197691 [Schizophyllum commune Loenen D]|nr:hypothetical protein K525DRAFT_197691 [Schizophyllum commune Loenen D]
MPFVDDRKMHFLDDRKMPFVDDRKIPSLDGPVFQNGIPIVSQAPVPFPRPIGEQLAPPVDDRRRREDGWSGEWNMDIDDVRRRLRGLK